MPGNVPGEITQLLGQWSGGDRKALDELIPIVYQELRRMAHRHMARERTGHTLQATELVDEVYLKLKDARAGRWQNRAQFFAVAAEMGSASRFILVIQLNSFLTSADIFRTEPGIVTPNHLLSSAARRAGSRPAATHRKVHSAKSELARLSGWK